MKQWCFWAGCHAKIVIGAVSCGHANFQQCCCWCFSARPCQSCRDDLILKWEFCRAFPESGISLVVPDTVFFLHLNFCTCWETTSKAHPAGWMPGRYLLIPRQMCHMLIACCATCPLPAELLTSVRGCLRPTQVCSHPVVRAYTTMWEKLTLVQEGKASAEADWEGSRGTSPEICARLCRRPIAQRDATFPMSG